jgi:putative ABC transport system permease protein
VADGSTARNVFTVPVSSGWFHTYGTRLISGRDFTDRDARGSAGVAIVNESFVRRFLDAQNPVGRELIMDPTEDREALQIVGVVSDAAFVSVREEVQPAIYRPLAQFANAELLAVLSSLSLSIRPAGSVRSEAVRHSIASSIERVDAGLAVTFLPLATYLDAYYTRERLLAVLSGFFGALAVLLAAVGLYGTTAYFVNQRQREIAVRMALGARADEVVGLVVRRFTLRILAGIAAGTILGWWTARLVRTLLYGIDVHDRGAFTAAVAIIAIAGLIASWIPARRAAKLNPGQVLRS